MVGRDHEGGVGVEEVRHVGFPARECAELGFQVSVEAAGPAGELDEPVPFDRRFAGDRYLGVDAVQAAAGPVGPVLVEGATFPQVGGRGPSQVDGRLSAV